MNGSPLQWLIGQPGHSCVVDVDFFYSYNFVTQDYRNPINNGKYGATVGKPDANFPGSPKFYTIGYYDTSAEAQDACQTDYDTYGPNLPPGTL